VQMLAPRRGSARQGVQAGVSLMATQLDPGFETPRRRALPWLRANWWIVAASVVVVAGGVVAAVIALRPPSLARFYPAMWAFVLAEGQGHGSTTLPVTQVMRPGPEAHGLERYLPDPTITMWVSCIGANEQLTMRLEPGDELIRTVCGGPPAGAATLLVGPARLRYPQRVVVEAPADVRWRLIVVDPGKLNYGLAVSGER